MNTSQLLHLKYWLLWRKYVKRLLKISTGITKCFLRSAKNHPQSFGCFGLKFSTISGPFMIWFNDQFCKTKNLWSTFSPHNHPHFPLLITAPPSPPPPSTSPTQPLPPLAAASNNLRSHDLFIRAADIALLCNLVWEQGTDRQSNFINQSQQ